MLERVLEMAGFKKVEDRWIAGEPGNQYEAYIEEMPWSGDEVVMVVALEEDGADIDFSEAMHLSTYLLALEDE